TFHFRLHNLLQAIRLGRRRFEHQLIMHLQQHARLHFFFLEPARNADHRQFNKIGGGSLQRRIYSRALGERSGRWIAALHIWNRAAPAEKRLGYAGLSDLSDRAVDELAYTGISFKIAADVELSLFSIDAQLLRQPKWRLPI